jgi:hypothetical protein
MDCSLCILDISLDAYSFRSFLPPCFHSLTLPVCFVVWYSGMCNVLLLLCLLMFCSSSLYITLLRTILSTITIYNILLIIISSRNDVSYCIAQLVSSSLFYTKQRNKVVQIGLQSHAHFTSRLYSKNELPTHTLHYFTSSAQLF